MKGDQDFIHLLYLLGLSLLGLYCLIATIIHLLYSPAVLVTLLTGFFIYESFREVRWLMDDKQERDDEPTHS